MEKHLSQFILRIRSETVGEVVLINSKDLVLEDRVRDYCRQNLCGEYGINYSCPPMINTLDEFTARLKKHDKALCLSQITDYDISDDFVESIRRASELNRYVIDLEKEARDIGFDEALALTAGPCILCRPCKATENSPCMYPKLVHSSAEAVGINVFETCEKVGIDMKTPEGKIKWIVFLLL